MENIGRHLDLKKLLLYIVKHIWLVIICAAIGFAGLYCYTAYYQRDTYTARATMYVYNGNPNVINYQYTNISDLNSAVQLLDTYMVIVKSDKVMNVVVERLSQNYPSITAEYVAGSIRMGSVADTGVLRVSCVTGNPKLSADICNTILDVAPAEIIRVVSAGSIEIVDYATEPEFPDYRSPKRKGLLGAVMGGAAATALLVLLFLVNRKVTDAHDLQANYTPPVLASIIRQKKEPRDPGELLLSDKSELRITEGYAKLRMNLLYTLVGKERRSLIVTSAVSGEGKSTIASNLAISLAMSGKRVLLIDGDMRRATQRDIFGYDQNLPGLSNALAEDKDWWTLLLDTVWENLSILPAGHLPPNPSELLSLDRMRQLLKEAEQVHDLVIIDMPPINVVSDPLTLSREVAGCILVTREKYSDHREIRRMLMSAEMTGINVLGFVFYGQNVSNDNYYSKKYYNRYMKNYDNSRKTLVQPHSSQEKGKEHHE